ncbi:MAG: hypothetical protein J5822_09645 [Eubacteriaceae bacterium]|nr:hypothetical protein [Eubacteriaceae bacterium]
MKKKILAVLTALLLVLSVIPSSAVAYDVPSWFTPVSIKGAGISDDSFAKGVYNQISKDIQNGNYDVSSMTTTVQILNGYFYKKMSADYAGVKSMAGVNLVPGVIVDLNTNKIEDATPLGTVAERSEPVYLLGNPIHNWPAAIPNVTSASTYAIPDSWDSFGTARYIDNGTPKKQTVYFDVTRASGSGTYGDPDWDLENGLTTYTKTGAVEFTTAPTANATSAGIKVTGDGQSDIEATMKTFSYTTTEGNVPRGITPVYNYRIVDVFYYTLKVNTNIDYTLGFFIEKHDSVTGEGVSGAEYTVYKDKDCTELAAGPVTTAPATAAHVDGLAPGTYYLKETKPAPGYNLDTEVREVKLEDRTFSVRAEGTKTLDGITPDESTWKNDWQSAINYNMSALDLKLQETAITATAGSGSYSDVVLFIGGPSGDVKTVTSIDLDLAESEAFTGTVTLTYKGADGDVTVDVTESYKAGTLKDSINSLIDDKVGNITVSFDGEVAQNVNAYHLVRVTDEPVSLWVENSTGSSYDAPGLALDDGGTVFICDRDQFDDPSPAPVPGTEYNNSSNGTVNNDVRDYEHHCVCGRAKDDWIVVTDKILIGPRDAKNNDGAGYVNIGKKGKFEVKLTDKYGVEHTVTGIVDWNDDMTQACVFIDVDPDTGKIPMDLDVAIPFCQKTQPVPSTGVAATMLAWVMIALAMVYAIISVRKARKKA